MISYYELLGMIKDGNIPKKIKLHMYNTSRIYVAQYGYNEFYNYSLENEKDVEDNFKYYLAECFLEIDMFEEKIEIIEDNTIEKITPESIRKSNQSINDDIIDKINELVDEINKMKGVSDDE